MSDKLRGILLKHPFDYSVEDVSGRTVMPADANVRISEHRGLNLTGSLGNKKAEIGL